jgi:prepilin-type N-terminal cleavage/methylation domain-containing protein
MGTTRNHRGEHGLTLIELMITILIIPMIAIALGMGIDMAFTVQSHVASSVNSSSDLQAISSRLYQDTQSAAMLTTSSSAVQCGTGTQLLGLEWGLVGGSYNSLVSYSEMSSASSPTGALVRNYCDAGPNPTPTSSETVAGQLSAQVSPPTISPAYFNQTAGVGWVLADGVTNVSFTIKESASNSTFVLNSVPAITASYVAATPPGAPTAVLADPLSTSATVNWTPPTATGGAVVTGYTVTAHDSTTPANGNETCSTSGTTCDVTGLTEGDSYTFTVTATNSVGTGAASVPSPSVVADPPAQFGCTGNTQTFVVPSGVTLVMATVYGAQGGAGNTPGGLGGETVSKIHVTPAEVLTIDVGCQGQNADGNSNGVQASGGWNGGADGGTNGGGGGGGATDIRYGAQILEVAGGGGGGGGTVSTDSPGNGGSSGGYVGYGGNPDAQDQQHGGNGASTSSAGAGGTSNNGANGGDGTFGKGGSGGSDGGGGGGGYYGGGGGAGNYSGGYSGAGGGGGSSVAPTGGSSAGQANSGGGMCSIDY